MSEPYIGEIKLVAFNFAPRYWAMCDGQLIAIAQNQALYSLLGTYFGGDGRTTMGLPDLRGRVPIHQGQGPGLNSYVWAQKGGSETVTLNASQMPSHSHAATLSELTYSSYTPANAEAADSDKPSENNDSVLGAAVQGGRAVNVYNTKAPDRELLSKISAFSGSIEILNTGGSQSHYNMQPFLTLTYCIALSGLYPSRT